MRRPPGAFLVTLGGILVVATLSALVTLGIPPFDNFQFFIVSQVTGFFTLLVLGVLGGAAVGMLTAHNILSNRHFTPFERSVLEALSDIRQRLDRLEAERREAPPVEKPRR